MECAESEASATVIVDGTELGGKKIDRVARCADYRRIGIGDGNAQSLFPAYNDLNRIESHIA